MKRKYFSFLLGWENSETTMFRKVRSLLAFAKRFHLSFGCASQSVNLISNNKSVSNVYVNHQFLNSSMIQVIHSRILVEGKDELSGRKLRTTFCKEDEEIKFLIPTFLLPAIMLRVGKRADGLYSRNPD